MNKNIPSGEAIKSNIIGILEGLGIEYNQIRHDPVYNMEDVARVFGEDHNIAEDVKVLMVRLYKTKKEYDFGLVVWRGDRKVDWSNLANDIGARKVKMASPEEVKESLGIEIGALTPFGYPEIITTVFDSAITDLPSSFINPGIHNETISMKSADLKKAVDSWAKDKIIVTSSN